MNGNIEDMSILGPNDWPEDAAPDRKRYSLEVTRAQRLKLDGVGTDDGKPVLDIDGVFTFEDLARDNDVPTLGEGKVGTYAEISKLSVHLNATQDKNHGIRQFTFYPAPIEPQKAA